jgi:prepilin-type N-terminal cleavage/methylation domain-containing protein
MLSLEGQAILMNRVSAHRAFTLIEILVVISILAIVLAIAMPNFIKARETAETKHCLDNLRMIDSAKEQWAIENNASPSSPSPALSVLVGSTSYIKSMPLCPMGGTYEVGMITGSPTCSIGGGHTLP